MIGGDIQWGRHAEVRFHNFDSGLVSTVKSNIIDNNNVVVGDGLRIAFEYTKSDDQGYNTPNGKLVVYGLTEKTFNKLGERYRCEIEIIAGYLKSKNNSPRRLIYAVMTEKTFEMQNGVSVSTFTLLGDFIEKVIAHKMSLNLPKPTLFEIMVAITDGMGKGMKFDKSWLPNPEFDEIMQQYLTTYPAMPYGYSFAGTPKQELKKIYESFGIVHRVDGDIVTFRIADNWLEWHITRAMPTRKIEKTDADNSLVAENKTPTEVKDLKPIDKSGKTINLTKTHALVLKTDTGLIGSPILKNVDADKNYDQGLAEGEEVKSKKEQTVVIDKKTGQAKVDKKTGKVKMTKKPKKYKVTRRTVTAKCYINSMIDFDAMVIIISETGICDGQYRVRSVKINGDTDGAEWFMELELNE